MKICFQSVFTRDSNFKGEIAKKISSTMNKIEMNISEIKEIFENLYIRKAMGTNISD